MSAIAAVKLDPKLDLMVERMMDAPPELVWMAWTQPEHLKKWFTPRPWTIPECEVDLRPGGKFRVLMRGPAGEESPILGCYLDVVPNERLVWTDALGPGYRPSEKPFITAIITFERKGKGTLCIARALHCDEATRRKHEEMGFYGGWSTVLVQLSELVKTM